MHTLLLLLSIPFLYWPHSLETAPKLHKAGVEKLAVPPEKINAWKDAGFDVIQVTRAELDGRVRLLIPQVQQKIAVSSPTRSPWIDANGWRILRKPGVQYLYDVPGSRAALSAAEAFTYEADAIVKLESGELEEFGAMVRFLKGLPSTTMAPAIDLILIDEGSTATGEVMNLLTRRNLFYLLDTKPSPLYPLTLKLGTREFPYDDAADPSAFTQKIRKRIGDENRNLRLFGSEVVIGRMQSDGLTTRLHLLNYGGMEIDGLRVRVLGKFSGASYQVPGEAKKKIEGLSFSAGGTEFTLPRLGKYGFVELISAAAR